jgi:hypothetical protein
MMLQSLLQTIQEGAPDHTASPQAARLLEHSASDRMRMTCRRPHLSVVCRRCQGDEF